MLERWGFMPGDMTKFEVWPVPLQEQVLMFVGQRKLKTLRTAGVLDGAKTLELDDQLIYEAIAADLLTKDDQKDAPIKLSEFQNRLITLKSSAPKRHQTFSLLGCDGRTGSKVRSILS